MIIGPHLLAKKARQRPTKVFLCGPGIGGTNFGLREYARDSLCAVENVEVVYGEEIENISKFKRRKRDLQTLEWEFAHAVDFTFLILESPGSIAELGTFSMVDNLRGRLVVLVPSQFYKDKSYIARGPLSLISKNHQSNIVYFDRKIDHNLKKRILFPLTFYKYAHYILGVKYHVHLENASRHKDYAVDSYEKFVSKVRANYYAVATLVGIMVLGRPTFPELVASTALSPDQTSEALHWLYGKGQIVKDSSGRYRPIANYDDPIFDGFSTTAISLERARFIAGLDRFSVA